MSFSDALRNFALAPELVETVFPAKLSEYGEPLADGSREIVTIGAHWDDTAHTRKRAASLFDGTIQPRQLTDGRVCYRFMPQSDLEAEFLTDGIPGVEELTDEQVAALTPPPPEMP